MCEWKTCTNKATVVEAYQGKLYNLCSGHKKIVKKQKKVDNNI